MTTQETVNRIRARIDAPERVEAMLEEVRAISPDFIDDLRTDPLAALEQFPDIQVRYLQPQEMNGATCSIAGLYLSDTTPPTLSIADAARPRMSFTALHEFGHHLQQTTDIVNSSIMREDGGIALEEAASDLFAAQILVPDHLVEQFLPEGTPAATDLAELWVHADASRAAVAVLGVQRLQTDGFVLVLNIAGLVEFCATRGLPPLRRRSDQSRTEIVAAMRGTSTSSVARRTRFEYRDGIRGAELWAQAARVGAEYWIVVAAESSVPWEKLALPSFDVQVTGRWYECEFCHHGWMNFSAAHDCGTPVCPECDRCGCRHALKERTCPDCGLVKPVHLFDPGAKVCRDCD